MPESPTIAVIGASTAAGRAALSALAGRRLIAIDATPPAMPPGDVEVKVMDPRDRLLPLAVEGADVVVHAAFTDDLRASADTMYGHNVGATRNVLEAASKAGVSHVVLLSSATVYGAHADNTVPLREDSPRRANPGFAYAYQRMLAEELLETWAADHPAATVTILRLAPMIGAGVDTVVTQLLTGPRLVVPAGGQPLWQFCAPADVGSAVATVVDGGIAGTFNVAADGWLSTDEVASALGRGTVEVGQTTMAEALRAAATAGVAPAPPESVPYMTHPWVVDVTAMRDHDWRPLATNRDVLTAFARDRADDLWLGVATVSRADTRRAVIWTAAAAAWLLWRLLRRRRR